MGPTRRSKILGLALGERRALVAEVSSSGPRPVVERVGEFVYPDRITLADSETLGLALGQFLKENGFGVRSAVVGVPGKWLLTRRMDAPPASPDLVAESLRLQAEGEFSADGVDYVYDYAGQSSTSTSSPVMVMALPKKQADQIAGMMSAAKLNAIALTPFAATLAAVAGQSQKNTRVLLFGPGGAEFVSQNGTHPRAMRYLGPTSSPAAMLAGEFRRASSAAGFGAVAAAGPSLGAAAAPAGELLVWNDARLDDASLDALGRALGVPSRLSDVRTLGATDAAGGGSVGFAAAVALAIAGLGSGRDRALMSVDFLHSRLLPPKPVRVERRTLLIGIAIAAVVLIGLGGYFNLKWKRDEVEAINAKLASDEPAIKEAKKTIAKVTFAEAWQSTDPVFVSCLRDLAKSLPEDGQTFLTSLSLNEGMKGSVSGKSSSDREVLALLDRLQASGRFNDVKSSYDSRRPASSKGPSQPKPPSGAPTPAPAGGPPAPGPAMPQGMTLPPGVVLPPGVTLPPGMAMPSGAVAMAMPQGPGADPDPAGTMSPEAAMAMAQARGGKRAGRNGPPPGASPVPTPAPAGSPAGAPAEAKPANGPSPAASSEVSFVMTFNYVPG